MTDLNLSEMMKEEWHPDLEPYLVLTDTGMEIMHHPLVVEVFPIPGLCNRRYEHKLRLLEEADSYLSRLSLYERPYRLTMAVEWIENGFVDEAEAREVLASAWIDMEGDDTVTDPLVIRVVRVFRKLGYVTDNAERGSYPTGPVQVYRGGEPNGIAWSRERSVAEWFANRHRSLRDDQPEPVYSAVAPPAAILAQLFGRNEAEVVCEPHLLEQVKLVK